MKSRFCKLYIKVSGFRDNIRFDKKCLGTVLREAQNSPLAFSEINQRFLE